MLFKDVYDLDVLFFEALLLLPLIDCDCCGNEDDIFVVDFAVGLDDVLGLTADDAVIGFFVTSEATLEMLFS